MSIAQFDRTSIENAVAAQVGTASAKTVSNGDFARLLNDAKAEDAARRARTAAAKNEPAEGPATHHAASRTDGTKTDGKKVEKAADDQNKDDDKSSGKAHSARHAGHRDDPATAQASTTVAQIQPQPAAVQATAATVPATDGTDPAGGGDASAAGTPAGTGAAVGAPQADGSSQAAQTATVATPSAADEAAQALAAPTLSTLAALGVGRTATANVGTSPAGGKSSAVNAQAAVAKSPAAVKLASLTTALPQDFETQAAATPANSAHAAPADASAAANARADKTADPAADAAAPAPAALPADPTAALATAATATTPTEPPVAALVASTTPHAGAAGQNGDDTTAAATGTLTGTGTTPTAPGFATVNAGVAVSRAETASASSQNSQGNQTPLQLPAEQLAIAISRNAGRDGSQNFTIRLSPEKLGSVEVRLQVDAKGKTTANFVVEHAETLGLLKQDSQQLVQALQNAGVDTSGASLSFSLRDPGTGQAQNQSNGGQGRHFTGGGTAAAVDGADAADQPAIASNRLYDFKA